MKNRLWKEDVLKLQSAIRDCKLHVDWIYRYYERYRDLDTVCQTRVYAFRVLPVSYIDTVFAAYGNELREYTEWMSDRRFSRTIFTDEWAQKMENVEKAVQHGLLRGVGTPTEESRGEKRVGELPPARFYRALLHCEKVFREKGKIILLLSDPYGSFVSQPLDIPRKVAKKYVGNIINVMLYSHCKKLYEQKNYAEFVRNAVKENDRRTMLYDREEPIFWTKKGKKYRQIEVSDILTTQYHIKGKYGEKDITLSPFLEYVKSFSFVTTREDAVKALDSIEKKADSLRASCRFVFRVSPLELRVIMNDHVLYSFTFFHGRLCFFREAGHGFPRVKSDGCYDELNSNNIVNFAFHRYAVGKLEEVREQLIGDYSRRMFMSKPEVKDWTVYAPTGNIDELRFKSRKKLRRMKRELLDEYEWLTGRYFDRWNCTHDLVAVADENDQYKEDSFWDFRLCEHPDYTDKWRGSFFDKEIRYVKHGLLCQKKEEYSSRGYQVIWHDYFLKNGAKHPFEDLDVISYEAAERRNEMDLNADKCVTYVGFCDSISCIDGVTTVHLVDPSGDTYFYNLDIPADIAGAAAGHMCSMTCAYNYQDEGNYRLIEFEVIPYTLYESEGNYHTDSILYKKNIVINR